MVPMEKENVKVLPPYVDKTYVGSYVGTYVGKTYVKHT